jgi:hypothetical protein
MERRNAESQIGTTCEEMIARFDSVTRDDDFAADVVPLESPLGELLIVGVSLDQEGDFFPHFLSLSRRE